MPPVIFSELSKKSICNVSYICNFQIQVRAGAGSSALGAGLCWDEVWDVGVIVVEAGEGWLGPGAGNGFPM